MANFWKKFFNRTVPREEVKNVRRNLGVSAGVQINEDSALMAPAFYRGVMYLSTQIAKLPWEVKNKNNEIIEDDVATLLALAPNYEMNSFTFRLLMVQEALMSGNFYAEIERDVIGKPKALWPIPSANVQVKRTDSGVLVYEVSTSNSSATKVYLPAKNVYHIKNFHTKDGIVGQGVIAYALDTLGINLGADRMAKNLFGNGGLPSGVLTVPGALSDEAFLRIKESWDASYKGKSSGRVAVLEEGTKFEPTSLDPEAMQFLATRQFGVLEVARFLGLPPTKLFDVTAATFSNQENSNLEVATDTLDSWAVNIEMETDIKILNYRYGGKFSELDLYSVFRGDMKTRAEYFSKMMQTASMTPNEIRRREGMSPYPDGDRYFVAINNFSPADRIDEIIDAQVKGNDPAPKPATPVANPEPVQNPKAVALQEAAIRYLSERK